MILRNQDITFTVSADQAGQRLDRYLARRIGHRSRSSVQDLIRDGVLRIVEVGAGHQIPTRIKPSTAVQAGMLILLRPPAEGRPAVVEGPRHPLRVLHEDADLLIVDKPAGMLVHPAGTTYYETVIVELRERFGAEVLHLGHRLDRETSGVLVLARTEEANRAIKADFKARRIKKGYLAVVRGVPPWETAEADAPIGDGVGELVRLRQVIRADGADASTSFRRLRVLKDHALVACEPHTGRLHQIRVHLEGLGFPIVGDKIYGHDGSAFIRFREAGLGGGLEEELGHWRHALHAHWIDLDHPRTGERLRFEAPLAPDLEGLLDRLEEDDGAI